MKKHTLTLLAAAATLTALHGTARAEDPPASPLSFNVGAVTDYRYRGISQSRLKPALQGGADYAAPSGAYVGTWLSTISWIKDAGTIAGADAGKTPAEWDLYAGLKGDVIKDSLTYDVGGLYYLYVGNKFKDVGAVNANTFELYGALTYGVATLKYSHSLTNLFGFGAPGFNTKGSGYLDLTANFDLGSGFTLTPHVGHQAVAHLSIASYTDYSVTLGKDMGGGFSLSATLQGTDAKKIGGAYVYSSPDGKNLGKSTLVVGAKYSF
jgi:uncharacterized protein (TIGR02001 family)